MRAGDPAMHEKVQEQRVDARGRLVRLIEAEQRHSARRRLRSAEQHARTIGVRALPDESGSDGADVDADEEVLVGRPGVEEGVVIALPLRETERPRQALGQKRLAGPRRPLQEEGAGAIPVRAEDQGGQPQLLRPTEHVPVGPHPGDDLARMRERCFRHFFSSLPRAVRRGRSSPAMRRVEKRTSGLRRCADLRSA